MNHDTFNRFMCRRIGLTQEDQDIATRASQRNQHRIRAAMIRGDRADSDICANWATDRSQGRSKKWSLEIEMDCYPI